MKKFLAKLVNWEKLRKSNWTQAMESQGSNEDERKKIVNKEKEDLKKEWMSVKEMEEQAKKKELKKQLK